MLWTSQTPDHSQWKGCNRERREVVGGEERKEQ